MTVFLWLGVYAKMATLLLPVVCCTSIGAILGLRKQPYPADFIAMLATVVCTPALVFHTLMSTQLDNLQLLEVGTGTLLGLAFAAVFSAIALRSLSLPARTLGPALTFPNTGNLGLPIAQLAFGDMGLAVAVVFFGVNSMVQHTLGVWVMSLGGNRSQPLPKGILFACLLVVALRTADVAAPAPLIESARLVGSLAVPLMLLNLGYALATVSRAGIHKGAVLGALRLLIGLLAGALVIHLIDLPPLVASVMTLQFVMPVAIVNCIYVQRFSAYGDIAAGAVLVSTAAFTLLCPLLIWLANTNRF
jgi:malate permease and related proteins